MVQRAGNKNGVRLRDENDEAFGVKQTANVPHVLIGGNSEGASAIDTNLSMLIVSGSLGALNAELCLENHDIAMGTMVFQVSGTWKGKIVVEGAVDGTYNNLSVVQPGGTIAFTGVNNDNQNGVYRALIIGGYTHVRLRMSEYTSGSATVIMNGAPLVATPFVWQLTPANLNGRMEVLGADGATVATVEARKQTPTGNALNVQIGPGDVISNIPIVLDYDHHQIHEGETFRWSVYVSSLAANVSKDIQLVVPNITIPVGKNPVIYVPHIRFEAIADSFGQLRFYEGTTWISNGTPRTPIALERNGTYTPKLLVYEDPTVNVIGTLIWQGVNFAAKTSAGSIEGSKNEFPLKNNTSYCLRYTSGTAGLKVLIRIEWYEDLGV